MKPTPIWDEDHPRLAYCNLNCPCYGAEHIRGRVGPVRVWCAMTKEMPKLPDMCWECSMCLPGMALGKEACDE